jgi:hypothetical protein
MALADRREQITAFSEEVIAEEGKPRSISEHNNSEVFVYEHDLPLCAESGGGGCGGGDAVLLAAAAAAHAVIITVTVTVINPQTHDAFELANHALSAHQPPPVVEEELSVPREAFQHADDLQWRFIRLVNDQHSAVDHRSEANNTFYVEYNEKEKKAICLLDERRVLVDDSALFQDRVDREGLYGGVSVQLQVLPLGTEQVQQAIHQLVLPYSLQPVTHTDMI